MSKKELTKKEVVKALKFNVKIAKSYFGNKHSQKFRNETKGLIKGYEFAIILLTQKFNVKAIATRKKV